MALWAILIRNNIYIIGVSPKVKHRLHLWNKVPLYSGPLGHFNKEFYNNFELWIMDFELKITCYRSWLNEY